MPNKSASSTRSFRYLRRNEIEVVVRNTRRPFDNLADLQEFDCVVLGDVAASPAREPRLSRNSATNKSTRSWKTRSISAGLVVLGGPNSYGPGGWANTDSKRLCPLIAKSKT